MPSSENSNADTVNSQSPQGIAVDVAIARRSSLQPEIEYVGTTFPVREVTLRARSEGEIKDLTVDVGDRVTQGQALARIDDSISTAAVGAAAAEVAARQAEVTSQQAEVNEAIAQVERAKFELQQAKSDAARFEGLVDRGAVAEQQAELARTAVKTAEQAVRVAEQQVLNRKAAVESAQRRVAAQEALVRQERQRKSFTVLSSSVTGAVLERMLEPGDLARLGDEILRLGDLNQIVVRVQISERELSQIELGQKARVRLDAVGDLTLTGKVTQISLAADATTRLIPLEVTIPNPDLRLGRGLLARVKFESPKLSLVVPETALQIQDGVNNNNTGSSIATIFTLQRSAAATTVRAQSVTIGDRVNSRVEILSGLTPGTEYVVNSSRELKDGDRVRLSFLSESNSVN
ncbi:MAG: efflux RND transporter periplasmic adaptor subunit [Cyanobacteria bacterium J06623_7]